MTVDLVLSPDPEKAEVEAEAAMGRIAAVLDTGRQVVLGTDEPDGRVVGWVRDRTDLGRRLARAVAR